MVNQDLIERLPSIIQGYDAKNIWNCDETGLYWKALPYKGLAEKKACHGGKQSKLRTTVLLFVNASESPPIGSQRCKQVTVARLVLLSKDVLHEIRKLVREKRLILLYG